MLTRGAVAVAVLASVACGSVLPAGSSIIEIMNKMTDAFMASSPGWNCDWTRGTYMTGHMGHYHATNDSKLLEYAMQWGDHYGWKTCDGDTNANHECAVQTYVDLARITGNSSLIVPSRATMQSQVASNDTTSWWWVDATFMALPAFAKMAQYTGESAFYDQGRMLFEQTSFYKFALWNEEDQLFWRDDTYKNKTCPNGKNIYWSRGNGWAAAALARTIEATPESRTQDRQLYISIATKQADALKAIQTEDGYWPASLLDADQVPGPETTGSALFTYALASGINQGYLSEETFKPAVVSGWSYLTNKALQPSGLPGFCQPVGASPKPTKPSDWSDFCVGMYLLAASEILKMAP